MRVACEGVWTGARGRCWQLLLLESAGWEGALAGCVGFCGGACARGVHVCCAWRCLLGAPGRPKAQMPTKPFSSLRNCRKLPSHLRMTACEAAAQRRTSGAGRMCANRLVEERRPPAIKHR